MPIVPAALIRFPPNFHIFPGLLRRARTCVATGLLVVLSACATGEQTSTPSVPEQAARPATNNAIVVAAHPLAVDAGTAVLRRGGSAIDAAVAVQAMLGLVEPQSSGLGGGAMILVYDAATGSVSSYVGRETAPALATPALLDDAGGRPIPHRDAMLTGRATGVPGAVAVFAAAQRDHGKLRWNQLFDETVERAEQGFHVTPRLAQHIHGEFPQASAPDVVAYFSNDAGDALQVGDLLRNPAYAATLRTLARGGAPAFYHGDIARDIVARTHQPPLGGAMSERDLAHYKPDRTDPICRPLRQYVLCVPPPPTSGVGLLQLMALLDGTDIDQRGPDDPQSWFLFAEASRLMYADRDQYVGDPRFVPVPVEGLLDPAYIDARRKLIGTSAAATPPAPGNPAGAPDTAGDRTDEPGGTSHMVIVDAWGNAVSITTTVESFFGSGRMVDGFFLNNQLTDFSWNPAAGPVPAANAIAGGKRPRSSMTPAILLDRDGNFVGAIGSPGGSAIPAYIAKALVGLVYWHMPLQQAVDLPNLVARGKHFNGEATRFSPRIREELADRGITIRSGSGEDSGLHGVFLRDGVLEWAADPHREGVGRSPE
jgi:gamma-glutamyltranspeptidase/glutathione hydrolase